MIAPLQREYVHDLSMEPLPPLWVRRAPTLGGGVEARPSGVWCTGAAGQFLQAMASGIERAREVVLVASFLLTDATLARAMTSAAARGVRVYVLTASDDIIAKADLDDTRVDEHKRLLASLVNRALVRSAEHLHAKFVVVDPFIVGPYRPRAFLSTANFNRALTDGVELGVEFDGERAAALGGAFVRAFWNESTHELREANRLSPVAPPPGQPVVPDHATVLTTTKSSNGLRAAVVEMIRGARERLVVASFGLDPQHPAVVELRAAAARGVEVTVLTRPRPAVGAAARFLREGGVLVRAHDKLHAKAVVADGDALVMTANFESHGLDDGFEVGVRLDGPAASSVATVLTEWAATFPWEFRVHPLRGELVGEVWLADRGARDPRATVVEHERVGLPAVVARDALALEDASRPELRSTNSVDRFAHHVTYAWQVEPPSLPRGAKEQVRRGEGSSLADEVPVYEHDGRTYVKLRDLSEIELARRVARERNAVVVL